METPLTAHRKVHCHRRLFEKDGAMVDLPKLVSWSHDMRQSKPPDFHKQIELKHKYKYRLILDESISFDTVG